MAFKFVLGQTFILSRHRPLQHNHRRCINLRDI